MDIVWEDPPTDRRAHSKADQLDFVTELRKRPGTWAVFPRIYSAVSSCASAANRMKTKGAETTIRKQPDGSYRLYARWPAP